ncbi:Syntaxin-18 [Golovinomyces cichoracearum]|uniref:Syntaxin-18 n=1 Tax=Golovinomyces cichoracearum TaxID=62708 RepID=A0A420ITB6_9PEZI|nr:Syntaxin-18 [Golovinomyces cichoracearum]
MTDLLSEFRDLLRSYKTSITTLPTLTSPRNDHFIDEATKIVAIKNTRINEVKIFLRDIRQSYLSKEVPSRRAGTSIKKAKTKYLSDRDKEEIDAKIKQILRELDSGIRILEEAEEIRRQTEVSLIRKKYGKWGLGALGDWAAGGVMPLKSHEQELEEAKTNTISTHRENVLFYLRHRLQKWADLQASMMEKRITRELEKNRSILGKARSEQLSNSGIPSHIPTFTNIDVASAEHAGEARLNIPDGLSPTQIQMFEKDNQDMLRHYESTLNQVRTAEKSLVEISELQNQLVQNLAAQSAHIDQLVADSHLTTENIGGGNKQLKEATKRISTAKYVFYASCGLSISLIFWDLLI